MGHKNRKCLDNSYLPTELSAWAQVASPLGSSVLHEVDKKCHRFLPQNVKASKLRTHLHWLLSHPWRASFHNEINNRTSRRYVLSC
jgi:hypothetical protein